MRRISAQYVFTGKGPAMKRAIITIDDSGTIINIEDTEGRLNESHSIEFFNGIIVPGFTNCHCHLELSHMKGKTGRSGGLGSFLRDIGNKRTEEEEIILKAACDADNSMFVSGVNLCADICNTPATFGIKKTSPIEYINFLEVFGIDPEKAEKKISDILYVAEKARELRLPYYLVPHTVYSVSLQLFRRLRELTEKNSLTSLHFMESEAEKELVSHRSGPLMKYYTESGLISPGFETAGSHTDAVLNEITPAGNLILVHNTFVTQEMIRELSSRPALFWCLCPGSNLYIENAMPPVNLLREEGCTIVIGTDSLASNESLDILRELKMLQSEYPLISLEEMILWATINGAKALKMEDAYGSIETGKRPGLLLINNADLENLRLQPDSYVTRLV